MAAQDYIGTSAGHAGAGPSEADPDDEADELVGPIARAVVATERESGLRFDKAIAQLIPHQSRARLKAWIEDGSATLNGAVARPRSVVVAGDRIDLVESPAAEQRAFRPEPVPLAVVYEDDAILVLNKAPGLVVHPGAGNWGGTLLNGLLARDPRLARLPRAGIVHRLDADTSGLIVVARSAEAQFALVRQLQARTVTREYWAVAHGLVADQGTIDAALARDRRNPRRFAVSGSPGARAALTRYRRVASARAGRHVFSWVACRLETGRTHQIRVHFESIRHPLVGDPVYRRHRPELGIEDHDGAWSTFGRQALHACRLALRHPIGGEAMAWFVPPPADLASLMSGFGWKPLDAPTRVFDAG